MKRFNENPRSSVRRSRSVNPTLAVKKQLLLTHLSQLRLEIERKTTCLNDPKFEVNDAWLFEFVSQHAEYMAKAASANIARDEFRGTTDMCNHVLQHPSVLKLMQSWDANDLTGAVDSKNRNTGLDAPQSHSPASTEVPSSPDCSEELIAESPNESDCGSPTDCHPFDASELDAEVTTRRAPLAKASCPVTPKKVVPAKVSPRMHKKQLWPAHNDLPPSSGGEQMQTCRQRANSTGATTALFPDRSRSNEAGELLKKLQQRANRTSWQGLSPRSQRLARWCEADGELSEVRGAGNLAERRKLLEVKLASCGFQKHASSSGA